MPVNDDIDDDEWERWIVGRRNLEHQGHRTFHPGCLIVIAVCILIWVAAILGAIRLTAPPTPTRVTLELPPPPATTGAPFPYLTRTVDGTPTVVVPEDLDAP